jgi:hypothetical protein
MLTIPIRNQIDQIWNALGNHSTFEIGGSL